MINTTTGVKRYNTAHNSTPEGRMHRILGQKIYNVDFDYLAHSDGATDNLFSELTYVNNIPTTVAIIDYKYPGPAILKTGLSDTAKWANSIRYLIHFSENELKVPKPFFTVITYMDGDYGIPMFFVIPMNKPAFSYWMKNDLPMSGEWMTVRRYSKFQHALRCLKWNPNETLDADNVASCNLPPNFITCLGELPNDPVTYQLVPLHYSWLQ